MNWKVPLADLDYGVEEESAVLEVIKSRWLTMGEITQEFEAQFAKFLGVKHALAAEFVDQPPCGAEHAGPVIDSLAHDDHGGVGCQGLGMGLAKRLHEAQQAPVAGIRPFVAYGISL